MPHPVVVQAGREALAKIAEKDGEITFAREVRGGCWDHRADVRRMILAESFKVQQIKGAGISGFSQMVTLTSSSNPHLDYPCKGVLRILEQGTDLSIVNAVFHRLHDDNTLGPPVSARAPVFTYGETK